MSEFKEQPIGTLKITCPEVTATYFMPGFLNDFAKRYPKVAVELLATNRNLDIVRERIDFAFRVGATGGQDQIVRRISAITRVLVAAPAYLQMFPPPETPTDLTRHRCLLHDARAEWGFAKEGAAVVVKPTPTVTSDSMGFLLQTSLAGGGVALLPAYVCQPSIVMGRLKVLMSGWDITPYEMVMVFPKLKNQSRAQTAFREFVNSFDFSAFRA
jgi:DNA-binding transcriptional LysR family regulator